MICKEPVSVEYLATCVRYDPLTGLFVWLNRHDMRACWNTRFAGKPAFTATEKHGYLVGRILGKLVKAHRAAWALHYGEWPTRHLDHEDNNTSNNKIRNLRLATRGQNMSNRVSKVGTSKYLGVYWEGSANKWRAAVRHDGAKIDLGLFEVEEDAARAYDEAARIHHGEFANPNFN